MVFENHSLHYFFLVSPALPNLTPAYACRNFRRHKKSFRHISVSYADMKRALFVVSEATPM
ncbi:MAG: hypothetical protein GX361_00595 [Bacteroidales bacterium]|nr:hypothetical protein [Bacteroidales bacterium]